MASKIILTLTVFTCLAAIILALPADFKIDGETTMKEKIEEIKEAIIEQDVRVGLDGQGRLLLNANTFNLSATLAGAPNNTASFTFIPLATILFGGQNGLGGLFPNNG